LAPQQSAIPLAGDFKIDERETQMRQTTSFLIFAAILLSGSSVPRSSSVNVPLNERVRAAEVIVVGTFIEPDPGLSFAVEFSESGPHSYKADIWEFKVAEIEVDTVLKSMQLPERGVPRSPLKLAFPHGTRDRGSAEMLGIVSTWLGYSHPPETRGIWLLSQSVLLPAYFSYAGFFECYVPLDSLEAVNRYINAASRQSQAN
jgi:hypothetical protein